MTPDEIRVVMRIPKLDQDALEYARLAVKHFQAGEPIHRIAAELIRIHQELEIFAQGAVKTFDSLLRQSDYEFFEDPKDSEG